MIITLEVPEEHAAFMLELLHELPYVRILPPATEAEAAERQRIEAVRKQLYHGSENAPTGDAASGDF